MLNLSGFTMTRNEKCWENESVFWSRPVGSRKTGYVETCAAKLRGDAWGYMKAVVLCVDLRGSNRASTRCLILPVL